MKSLDLYVRFCSKQNCCGIIASCESFQRFFVLRGVIIVMDIVTTSCKSFSGKSRQMEVMRSFPATMRLHTLLAFAAVPGEESEENTSSPALFHTRPSLQTRSSSTTLPVGAARVFTPTNCGDSSSEELSLTSNATEVD